MAEESDDRAVAVLVSGGLDSAVLCVDLLKSFERVHPLYVRFGLRWEAVELTHLRTYLDAVARPGLRPLHVIDEPVVDVYGAHWSTSGSGVPDDQTPDEAVYLPGRNLLLSAKAAVWCRLHNVEALAFGTLSANPFSDSTEAFFHDIESAANRALGGRLTIVRPYSGLSKPEVVRKGLGLPLEHTFSCLSPVDGRHCGRCNKCAERRKGFRDAGCADRTAYAEG
jgi:7-cyano-7-deazaguanine synthase